MNPTGKCKCGCGATTNIFRGEHRDYLQYHRKNIPGMNRKKATCHPDKPVHGNGLCLNCYNKQLYKNNPEYAEKQRIRAKKDWKKAQEKRLINPKLAAEHAANQQNRRFKHRYGITIVDYNKMLEKQAFSCAICGTEHSEQRKLHVDHNHKTEAVRALLCGGCNAALGVLERNPEYLQKCHNYLEKHE